MPQLLRPSRHFEGRAYAAIGLVFGATPTGAASAGLARSDSGLGRDFLEMRKLLRVDLLIVDDFALQALDAVDVADVYELIVERHRAAATVVTSNREPIEWLGLMADPLLAQAAIDRLQSAAHELVLDGESYRKHRSQASRTTNPLTVRHRHGGHHVADAEILGKPAHVIGERVVPSSWRTTLARSLRNVRGCSSSRGLSGKECEAR